MAITIGIPILNAEKTLGDAIRSIFAQSYQDWELILVDDGSVDRSIEIARSIRDKRVRVICDGTNKKLPYRLNQIVAEARNEFISRMDADDLMAPLKLEKQLPFFADKDVYLVSTGICSLSNDSRPLGYRNSNCGCITLRGLLRGYGIAHAPVLGRTSWFQRNHYDVSVPRAEDIALWCSALRAGNLAGRNIRAIGTPLYFYREHHGDLRRILNSHSDLRKLIRRYGAEAMGEWGMRFELLRSHFRSVLFRTFLALGAASFIINRRNRAKADPAIMARIQADLNIILATKVPGLDGV